MAFNNYLLLVCFALLIGGATTCVAQEADTGKYLYNFKVRNPKMIITILEKDTVLYTDHKNKLKITITGKNKISHVELRGGSIKKSGDCYIVTVSEGSEAVLAVFIIKPNGKRELGASKTYPIIHLKDPESFFGDVRGDSIILREDLLKRDKMYALLNRFGRTYPLRIVSYEMVVFRDALMVPYPSYGNQLSPEMRRYIQVLQPGQPLYFENIYCQMPNGQVRKLKDMLLYVDCRKPYEFAK